MSRLWHWLEGHAAAVGVVLTAIALLSSALSVLHGRLTAPPLPDLLVSSPMPFRALDGFRVSQRKEAELPKPCSTQSVIFGAGFKVELTLSHNKQGDLPISISALEIVNEYEAGPQASLNLDVDADVQRGTGTEIPYKFEAWLHGDRVEIERWTWKEDGSTVTPRSNDLLDSAEPRRIVLRNDADDDVETVIGTIEATEPGLYRVWLRIRGVVGDRTIEKETDHACIYFSR